MGLHVIFLIKCAKDLCIFVIKVEKFVTDNAIQTSTLGYGLQDYSCGLDHPSERIRVRYYINDRQPEKAAKCELRNPAFCTEQQFSSSIISFTICRKNLGLVLLRSEDQLGTCNFHSETNKYPKISSIRFRNLNKLTLQKQRGLGISSPLII